VKQGDAFSIMVFNFMLYSVLKEVDPGASIATRSVQIFAYADDVAIISRSVQKLKITTLKMTKLTNKISLKINVSKTKYLTRTKSNRKARDLIIGDYNFGITVLVS